MEDTTSLIPLVGPNLFTPVLSEMEKTSGGAAKVVQEKLLEVEKRNPGASLDLLISILKASQLSCNVHEVMLRQHGINEIDDVSDLSTRMSRGQESVKALIRQLNELKFILGQIPDQINVDRTTFLTTIKQVAGSIKGILDTIETVSFMLPNPSSRALLDLQKREFVKYSKRFSMTLQGFFRDGTEKPIYVSALLIINQANVIIVTMKQL